MCKKGCLVLLIWITEKTDVPVQLRGPVKMNTDLILINFLYGMDVLCSKENDHKKRLKQSKTE